MSRGSSGNDDERDFNIKFPERERAIKNLYVLFIAICSLLAACSEYKDQGRNKDKESQVLRKISLSSTAVQRLDEIVGKSFSRICLQGKYIPREDVFEKAVGRPVDHYAEIAGKQFIIWWIFDAEGHSYWIKVPDEIATLSPDTASICFRPDDMIHLERDSKQLIYTFERK